MASETVILAVTPEFVFYCKIVAIILSIAVALITGSAAIIGWFLKETIKQIRETDAKQWSAIAVIQQELQHTKGECEVRGMVCPHLTRRVTDEYW